MPRATHKEEPDISHIVIEDGAPVDGIFSERQMRLLTHPLYTSWDGNGRKFAAFANVGLFYELHQPPIVPDVMLSMDVEIARDMTKKKNRTYFKWEFGKPPEISIEVVSNRVGGEIEKLALYARAGVRYVVIYDPLKFLRSRVLRVWRKSGSGYVEMLKTTKFLPIGLGLVLWDGEFEGMHATWLRWCDKDGNLLLTGEERAEAERQKADAERQKADAERQKASDYQQQLAAAEEKARRLLERLRELGFDEDAD